MDRKFKSILEELDYAPKRDRDLFIESRVRQMIASYDHLVKLIEESYDDDLAIDLKKRLFLSVKNQDEEKFSRKIREIRDKK